VRRNAVAHKSTTTYTFKTIPRYTHLVPHLSVFPTKYYSGNHIKKNEMGGARGTYGQEKRCVQGFDGEDLRVDGKIIFKFMLKKFVKYFYLFILFQPQR
jgi:hypothetical protein